MTVSSTIHVSRRLSAGAKGVGERVIERAPGGSAPRVRDSLLSLWYRQGSTPHLHPLQKPCNPAESRSTSTLPAHSDANVAADTWSTAWRTATAAAHGRGTAVAARSGVRVGAVATVAVAAATAGASAVAPAASAAATTTETAQPSGVCISDPNSKTEYESAKAFGHTSCRGTLLYVFISLDDIIGLTDKTWCFHGRRGPAVAIARQLPAVAGTLPHGDVRASPHPHYPRGLVKVPAPANVPPSLCSLSARSLAAAVVAPQAVCRRPHAAFPHGASCHRRWLHRWPGCCRLCRRPACHRGRPLVRRQRRLRGRRRRQHRRRCRGSARGGGGLGVAPAADAVAPPARAVTAGARRWRRRWYWRPRQRLRAWQRCCVPTPGGDTGGGGGTPPGGRGARPPDRPPRR